VNLRNVHRQIQIKTPQKALLGQIAHKVLDDAAKNYPEIKIESWTAWFEQTWHDVESEFFKAYEAEWSPSPVAPIVSWKAYFKTKSAAKGLIGSRLESNFKDSEFANKANPGLKVFTEKLITNENLRVLGYVDRIVLFPDGAHVYDYKFGQSALDSPDYKIQLGIYSILTTREYGVPVTKAAVIAGAGKEFSFDFESGYLSDLESSLQIAIEKVDSGTSSASPSLKNCRFCSFKPVCKDFNESGISAENGIPLVVKGVVKDVRELSDQYMAMSVTDETQYPSRIYEVTKVPIGYAVQSGDVVHISGPMQFFSQTSLEFKANTIFWRH
jgi:predicted RecB family nuclease